MASEIRAELETSLWGDFDHEASFPAKRPLLAHYTSIATLQAIVETNEVWFSNPLYMNDWEELLFGMIEGRNVFRTHDGIRAACKTPSAHETVVGYLDGLFNEFDGKHVLDTYVLCLSEHAAEDQDGQLSMWRAYGDSGDGAALVFDSRVVEPNEESPLVIANVRYGSTEERRGWIAEKATALAAVMETRELDDEDLFNVAGMWIERLKQFALFSKHTGFSDEREWRVVYFSERDTEKTFRPMMNVAVTAQGAEPKLRMAVNPGPLGDLTLERLVDRIILGPTAAGVMAERTIKRMLELNGKAALAEKVVASTIPLRRRGTP